MQYIQKDFISLFLCAMEKERKARCQKHKIEEMEINLKEKDTKKTNDKEKYFKKSVYLKTTLRKKSEF